MTHSPPSAKLSSECDVYVAGSCALDVAW